MWRNSQICVCGGFAVIYVVLSYVILSRNRPPCNRVHDSTNQNALPRPKAALPKCGNPNLGGRIKVELNKNIATKFPEKEAIKIAKGGGWKPENCIARKNVAIIIPLRNRDVQLKMFLYHMHPFLQKQSLAYRMFVVEQLPGDDFNKGSLLNIGFLHAQNISKFDCFIFHDVDYLPEDDRNDYGCLTPVRHFAYCTDINEYKPIWYLFMGGVFSATKKAFEKVNGMSNLYFGWGGEDDDVYLRFYSNGYNPQRLRPAKEVARYTTNKVEHTRSSTPSPARFALLKSIKLRWPIDGLNTLKYHLMETVEEPLYTIIRVKVKQSDYNYPICNKKECHYK